jgi:hypothetical protein
MKLPVSVADKELTGSLSLLNATLTKNRGGGGGVGEVMVNQKSDKEGGSSQELSQNVQLFILIVRTIYC